MEEVLYTIKINKGEDYYQGRIYSDIDGVKEFENERIDRLFRDIIIDMQMALDEFSSNQFALGESYETIR